MPCSRFMRIFVLSLAPIAFMGCEKNHGDDTVGETSQSDVSVIADTGVVDGSPIADASHAEMRELTPYELPNDQVNELFGQPYTYPYQSCMPAYEGAPVDEAYITENDQGEREICVWQNAQGCAPEGQRYTEWGSCEVAMTTSARFYKNPGPKYESDPSILNDSTYQREAAWVQTQIRNCGCVCCHDAKENGIQTNFATAFDISAPGVWADTFSDFGLLTAAGIIDTELLGGTFEPSTNFGFDRSDLIFPTTDAERMSAFFRGEIERRGLSEERIQELIDAVPLRFAGLYTNYAGETVECEPGIGVDAEGYVHWGSQAARYVYVMDESAKNVADPPGLDRPEGTLWRLDIAERSTLFESGSVTYGQVPEGARQEIPRDEPAPALVPGQRYKFFVLRDFGPTRLQNCYFTFEAL